MAAIGLIGMGSVIELGTGSTPTFAPLTGAYEMTLPNPQTDQIDTTHYGSGGVREFIGGMKDAGEVTISLIWVPASATDTAIKAVHGTGEACQLRFKVGATGTANTWLMTETWDAICTGYERNPPMDDKLTATATFKIGAQVL